MSSSVSSSAAAGSRASRCAGRSPLRAAGFAVVSLLWIYCFGCHIPEVRVSGTVVDATTLEPLSGVTVRWQERASETDERGRYTIRLPKGARVLSYAAANHPEVSKPVVVIGETRFDAVIPREEEGGALVVDRSDAYESDSGETWPSDREPFGWAIADAYGNTVEDLKIGQSMAHRAPVWTAPDSFTVSIAPLFARAEQAETFGVYHYAIATGATHAVSLGPIPDYQYRACSAAGDRCASSGLYGLHISGDGSQLRQIGPFELNGDREAKDLAWGSDGRIYVSVAEATSLEPNTSGHAQRAGSLDRGAFVWRSHIAAINPDGTEYVPHWLSDEQHDYLHPFVLPDGSDLYYCRRSLDDGSSALWAQPLAGGEPRLVTEDICRLVWIDQKEQRVLHRTLYELLLRDLATGREFLLLNQLDEVSFRRW
jgi:hypothetical protein